MGDTCRHIEADPIDEGVVVPQRRVRPQCHQVPAKRSLCIRVLRVGNRLRDVGAVPKLRAAQRPNESVERFGARELRCNAQSDTRPVLWAAMLHDEAKHLRKIGLLVQPT